MTTAQAVRISLSLLERRDRATLILLALAQMLISGLDLVAVLLVGAVTVGATSLAVGASLQVPGAFDTMLADTDMSDAQLLAVLGITAALLMVTKSLASVLLTRGTLLFLARRQVAVSGRLAGAVFARPLLDVLAYPSQLLAFSLTGGVSQVVLVILGQTVVVLSEVSLLALLFAGLMAVDVAVTVFAMVFFAGVALVLVLLFSGWAARVGRTATEADVASMEAVQETVQTYRELSVTHRRQHRVAALEDVRAQAAGALADAQFISQVPKYLFEVALVVGALLLAGSQLATTDLPTALGSIAVFLAAGMRIVPSLLRLQSSALTIRSAVGIGGPTFRLIADLPTPGAAAPSQTADESTAPHGFIPEIALESVSFRYPGQEVPALVDVSLRVAPGESLALVGATGSGKSTIADLALGILEPASGKVSISGLNPRDAARRWPGGLAYVPQSVAIVRGTVRDNVALGVPATQVDDEQIWRALELAHLAQFLRSEREGLDTQVGERGAQFSGGQLQRLGIARALYCSPRVLVLDEATSALDSQTERAIADTLHTLRGHVSTIIIAHRLATIRDCDRVAFVHDGRLAAVGSFDEVRTSVPEFDRQARLQGV